MTRYAIFNTEELYVVTISATEDLSKLPVAHDEIVVPLPSLADGEIKKYRVYDAIAGEHYTFLYGTGDVIKSTMKSIGRAHRAGNTNYYIRFCEIKDRDFNHREYCLMTISDNEIYVNKDVEFVHCICDKAVTIAEI